MSTNNGENMTFTEEIHNAIISALERASEQIRHNIDSNGLTASGSTANSISVERTNRGGRMTGRQAFGTLEHGRKAGAVPSNITDIIKEWIQDKGISVNQVPYIRQPSANWQPKYTVAERSLNLAAGAIAHSIAEKGTRLYQEGGDESVYTPVINAMIDELQATIGDIVVRHTIVNRDTI